MSISSFILLVQIIEEIVELVWTMRVIIIMHCLALTTMLRFLVH